MSATQEAGLVFNVKFVSSSDQDRDASLWIEAVCKELTKPRSIDGAMIINVLSGGYKIGPVLDVSEDQGLMRIEFEVSSILHGTAWIRISPGITYTTHVKRQNSHQKLKEWIVFFSRGTAVAQTQPEDPDLCTGRLVAFHLEVTPPPPPNRMCQAGHRGTD